MKSARWVIAHQGRKILAATKAEARKIAQRIADDLGAAVTVRPVTKNTVRRRSSAAKSSTLSTLSTRANPARRAGAGFTRAQWDVANKAMHTPRQRYYIVQFSNPYNGQLSQSALFGDRKTADAFAREYAGRVIEYHPPARPTFKANPDPSGLLPLWNEQRKGRKMRLDYLAATKARRLAKGLRGRDRGGAVKAHERAAAKTGRFVVHAKNAKEAFVLYRPTRAAAERLAHEFKSADYRVQISEV